MSAEGPKESRISRLKRELGLESFSLMVLLRPRPSKKSSYRSKIPIKIAKNQGFKINLRFIKRHRVPGKLNRKYDVPGKNSSKIIETKSLCWNKILTSVQLTKGYPDTWREPGLESPPQLNLFDKDFISISIRTLILNASWRRRKLEIQSQVFRNSSAICVHGVKSVLERFHGSGIGCNDHLRPENVPVIQNFQFEENTIFSRQNAILFRSKTRETLNSEKRKRWVDSNHYSEKLPCNFCFKKIKMAWIFTDLKMKRTLPFDVRSVLIRKRLKSAVNFSTLVKGWGLARL